ncbi:MAG TPA: MmgE/PrpD family protein [Candidatus Binatia bacterium]|nr:MmgE/PrpD family protein [Candidatus Binatia bacterium]
MTTASAHAVTRGLASAIAGFRPADLPAPVAHEAKRSLFNILAVAIGASRHEGVEIILRVAGHSGGTPTVPIAGRAERADAQYGSLANGFAAHVDDYDDTHLVTVIHPSAAAMATLLGMLAYTRPSGARALTAFALGCEVQLRVGVAISPAHYDHGWHITGTCGVLGAAAAAAWLLELDADRTAQALGIAASSLLGHRESFGSMVKAFHAGKAAANGILAAILAQRGFTAPPDALEAPHGFADVTSIPHRIGELDVDLRKNFELLKNTYKPYPCGIVAHPAIDAAVALSPRIAQPAAIERVTVRCHPLVPELMGNPDPHDGLQARFSAIHGVAAGICDGRVGLAQFSDERVIRDDVRALRAKTELSPQSDVARDEVRVEVRLSDGTRFEEHVEHARGSLERPLTDKELFAKAQALVDPIFPGRTAKLREAVGTLADAPETAALIEAIVPDGARGH